MNILGLIPARGGSKAIPRKNIIPLAGKPMLAYTCQAALKSERLTRALVNTDDREIAEVSRQYGLETPFLRPSHLAQDRTPILPVINHTLEWLLEVEGFNVDIVVLLQPTSPLRTAGHIDSAVSLFLESQADTLVSVQMVPHHFNPVSLMKLDDRGYLQPYQEGELILRRQEKPQFYARNGPAILITRRMVLDKGRLYGERVIPFEMGSLVSLDVDDTDDLILVEALLRCRLLNEKHEIG